MEPAIDPVSHLPNGQYTQQTDTPISDLLNSEAQNAWTAFAVTGINDNGAIVGTATYTQSGNNTNITNGQHGVLLAPAYEIQVDAFIPQEYVPWPFNNPIASYYYAGDKRKTPLDGVFNSGTATFQKSLSYRVRQKVMATVFKELDPDGSQEKEESNEAKASVVGMSYDYTSDQFLPGGDPSVGTAHLSPTATPHDTGQADPNASPNSVNVTVTHPASRVVQAEITATMSNPIATGSSAGPIFYDLTIKIDATNPAQPTYTLTGNHKLFPAYEVYINGQLIHDYSPIPDNRQPSDLVQNPFYSVPSVSDTSITDGTTKPLTGNITQ